MDSVLIHSIQKCFICFFLFVPNSYDKSKPGLYSLYVTLCAIGYQMYNLKYLKNVHEGLLLLESY